MTSKSSGGYKTPPNMKGSGTAFSNPTEGNVKKP